MSKYIIIYIGYIGETGYTRNNRCIWYDAKKTFVDID